MVTLIRIALRPIEDALRWVLLLFRSTESVQAENLFLRRQLALYIERGVHRDGSDAATRHIYNNMIHTIGVNSWKKLTPAQQQIFREESASSAALMRKLIGDAEPIRSTSSAMEGCW
jgi:hypothetical protein